MGKLIHSSWFRLMLVAMAIISLIPMVINYLYVRKQSKQKALDIPKTWIHRGLYDNKMVFENTLAAFDSVKNYPVIQGIELDVFYIDSINDFVVTHDIPNRYHLPQLLLSEVLSRYDSTFCYWIDLKNLTNENREIISTRFKKMTNDIGFNGMEKLFIESGNAKPLGFLAAHNLNSIYWIQYNRDNFAKQFFKKLWIKWNFIQYDFKGATIGASLVDDDFKQSFEAVPKFIFHIYTPTIFDYVNNQKNVVVNLVDYIPQ